ncbi:MULTISPECIES: AI-2E family transporter [Glutamicibacter]|uniref:Permease n=1 Tax=Glutamicibacter arilaitensis (strain DSM 16368 / CIP 108037 / IAM 15318 / JCM 13566 / NCIMB 14258 / Re117) TaxID=861360 RepID=A0ABP1U0R2_GLUAR|nr:MULTISPECIES: AI-2E family transporter [Glutamicibacter]CBT74970.1 putative permease [Glutamicibacter arilaitensis Re117]HCH49059.1 AI-2E family transporter [Glutamicibacter sp.]
MKSSRFDRLRRLRVSLPSKPANALDVPRADSTDFQSAEDMPYAVRMAAAWAWRFLIVVAALGVLVWALSKISLLVIPVLVSALLAGLLSPVVNAMNSRLAVPRGLAVGITLIGFFALVTAGLSLAGQRLTAGFNALWTQALAGIEQVQNWLFNGPLKLTNDDLQSVLDDTLAQLRGNATNILSEAISWTSAIGQILTGTLLAIFALIFLLLDGRKIGLFLINLLPRRARPAMDGALTRGWASLVSYVRVQMVVAMIDAIGIGLGAFFLGVPLAMPLGVLVFIGSFIPIVGALITGALAVLLALVANGWINALIMLAVVLLVQQAESNILQPLIMGKAVSLHPLAVVLAVAGGTMLAGIPGALFAVPLLAVLNAVIRYLSHRSWETDAHVIKLYGEQIIKAGSAKNPPVKNPAPAVPPADIASPAATPQTSPELRHPETKADEE